MALLARQDIHLAVALSPAAVALVAGQEGAGAWLRPRLARRRGGPVRRGGALPGNESVAVRVGRRGGRNGGGGALHGVAAAGAAAAAAAPSRYMELRWEAAAAERCGDLLRRCSAVLLGRVRSWGLQRREG